jgi:hypothetical protein
MNVSTVSMSDLIDRALLEVQHPLELGHVVVGSGALTAEASSTELTLEDPTGVEVNDVIEFPDGELLLVTAKSAEATPVLTVHRGYYGTTRAAHAEGAVGTVNPQFPRWRVKEAVRRSISRIDGLGVPLVLSETLRREEGRSYVDMPEDCREVITVKYVAESGRIWELDRWTFHEDLPSNKFSTGKTLVVAAYARDDDDLEVTYRAHYRWSSHPDAPGEDSTIDLPEGAEDLPAMYAAAWLAGAREISRHQLDRSEEWAQSQAAAGQSGATVRALWQNFYRALDEAKRIVPVPVRRPYVRRPRL